MPQPTSQSALHRHRTIVLGGLLLVVVLLLGCGTIPTSQRALAATAATTGCWGYGHDQARAVTPRPRPTSPLEPTLAALRPAMATFSPKTPTPPIYPTCTPEPDVPTITPRPPTPYPTVPPQTPQRPRTVGAPSEVGDPAGVVHPRGLTLAINPVTRRPVVGFIGYAFSKTGFGDGQVWMRAQDASGAWWGLQAVNTTPVTQYYGGLGVAVTPEEPLGTIHVIYSTGDPKGDATLYHVTSTTNGETWGFPESLDVQGSVHALRADSAGGLHLLISQDAVFYGALAYGYLPPGGSTWQWHRDLLPQQYTADLAVLEINGARSVWIVSGTDRPLPAGLHILSSTDDGRSWTTRRVPHDRLLPGSWPTLRPTIITAPRRDGGLIAVAWSSYGQGGVFGTLSTDGGTTWTPAERISQYANDGAISSDWDYGVEPSLVYDVTTDQLAASWIAVETDAPDVFPGPVRSYLAVRDLATGVPGADWQYALTPDNWTVVHPPLISAYRRAYLYGTPDGDRHWMLTLDERNYQYRVYSESITVPSLIDEGQS